MTQYRPPTPRGAYLFSATACAERYREMVDARTTKTYAPRQYESSRTSPKKVDPEELKFAEIEKNMTSFSLSDDDPENNRGCCLRA